VQPLNVLANMWLAGAPCSTANKLSGIEVNPLQP
jgi:hypothetical protein